MSIGSPSARAAAAGPLVTVVIPTWNRLPYLREAVASVRAQSYPYWELRVADDGSDDGTDAWLAGLGDPRIRHLALARDGHMGRVRNRAIEAGSGELVAFLDSDDVWVPERLERGVSALRRSGLRWGYADAALMDERGGAIPMRHGHYPRSGWVVEPLLRFECGVAIGTLLVERTLLAEVGGFCEDPRLRFRGDLELVLRLALRAETVAVPDELVRIRQHPGRSTMALSDPFLRTALVFELFLRHLGSSPPRTLAALARRQHAHLLAQHAAGLLGARQHAAAARLYLFSLAGRPGLRRWLGALSQGLRRRFGRRAASAIAG